MTLVLPALVLAILVVAFFSVVLERWSFDHSARRSMDHYLQTVLADLGALSLKPYKDQT